jgi:hypothetical protein
MIWVGYRPGQFHLLRGQLSSFSKTRGVRRGFCAKCGTSISYQDDGCEDELYLSIGFFDHPERHSPQAHAYWCMRLPFVDFADDLPKLDGYSRDRDPRYGYPRER